MTPEGNFQKFNIFLCGEKEREKQIIYQQVFGILLYSKKICCILQVSSLKLV